MKKGDDMPIYLDQAELHEIKKLLVDFTTEVHNQFSELCTSELSSGILPVDYKKNIIAAWEELTGGEYFTKLEYKIRYAKSEALYFAGLYGSQLALKLKLVKDWAKKWSTEKSKEVLKKYLEAIDVLLDSLLAAVGMKTALKEIKDCLLVML